MVPSLTAGSDGSRVRPLVDRLVQDKPPRVATRAAEPCPSRERALGEGDALTEVGPVTCFAAIRPRARGGTRAHEVSGPYLVQVLVRRQAQHAEPLDGGGLVPGDGHRP